MARLTSITRLSPPPDDWAEHTFLGRIACKINDCGRFAHLCATDDDTQARVTTFRCKSRLCPTCGRRRARAVAAKVLRYVQPMDQRRHWTLTIASTDDPLKTQLKRLTSSFAKLRRSKWGKRHIDAGIFTIEITYNPQRDQWHPHIHAIVDGPFPPHSELKKLWTKITKDSDNVWLEVIHSSGKAANYIANYVSKSQESFWIPDHRMVEYAEHLHGARMVQTFGKIHGVKLDRKEKEEKPPMQRVVALHAMKAAADQGDRVAAELHDRCLKLLKKEHGVNIPQLIKDATNWKITRQRQLIQRAGARPDPPPPPTPPPKEEKLWVEPPPRYQP